jgi:cysteinyl-tRNA synthetase
MPVYQFYMTSVLLCIVRGRSECVYLVKNVTDMTLSDERVILTASQTNMKYYEVADPKDSNDCSDSN